MDMKSLKKSFYLKQQKYPYWSSYIVFADTIRGKNFTKRAIKSWFKKLVKKEDYSAEDKCQILGHLYHLSKPSEQDTKRV